MARFDVAAKEKEYYASVRLVGLAQSVIGRARNLDSAVKLDPPADDMERIFDHFYRTDPLRTGLGHGLGLATARFVVTHHDGTIEANTNPTGGARFTTEFPQN